MKNKIMKKDIEETLIKYEKDKGRINTEGDVLAKMDYLFLKLKYDYNLPIEIQKEKTIRLLNSLSTGRIDSLVNNVVLEYKKIEELKTKSKINKAINQAKKYIDSLKEKNPEKEYIAYITDSVKVIRIDTYSNKTKNNIMNLNSNTFFNMVEDILKTSNKLNSETLVKDFTLNEDSLLHELNMLCLKNLNQNKSKKTDFLFYEWKELFKLNHDEKDVSKDRKFKERATSLEKLYSNKININTSQEEYEALFSTYTTYTIIVKLVAYNLLEDVLKINNQSFNTSDNNDSRELVNFFKNIENGKTFRESGIFNLMEGDFFTWYVDFIKNDRELQVCLYSILNKIQSYNFDINYIKENAIDMFRNLYEAFIPFEIRHALGEYFTPIWLTDYVYNEASPKKEDKIMDNCCGSGAFIISAIRNKKNEGRNLYQILEEVTGIDINPLSALMARVNYFLNISDLIIEEQENILKSPIVIPIYLANSCNNPKEENGFLIYDLYLTENISNNINLKNDKIKVKFPKKLLLSERSIFFKNIDFFEEEIVKLNKDGALAVFKDYNLSKEEEDSLVSLINILIELEKHDWNGIWARIIANRLCTSVLPKQDFILGNPPWVKWGDLPERYRNDLKNEAEENNLFNSQSKFLGANSLNICSLVSFLAGVKYVKPGGKVLYLMPKDLIFQESYEAWRNLGGKMSIEYCVDWEEPAKRKKVFNDVSMPFMTYVFKVL